MSSVSKLSSTPSDDVAGGYDYKFVDNPPDRVICVICHLPSRNPRLRGMGKTGRGAGVGVGDLWVKPGDGNWEIT